MTGAQCGKGLRRQTVEDKKLFWIEGTTRRWDGYDYFPEHPEQMLEWFNR